MHAVLTPLPVEAAELPARVRAAQTSILAGGVGDFATSTGHKDDAWIPVALLRNLTKL